MDERKISLLKNVTVARGASLNEEAFAKSKIDQYAAAMKTHRTKNPTPVHIYEDLSSSIEEQRFRMEWYKLKMENRKKWKVE